MDEPAEGTVDRLPAADVSITVGPRPGYRPCVGLFLLDHADRVFVGRRSDQERPSWQFPQGGIDPGEAPLDAALREMGEEIGTQKADVLGVSRMWRSYDLPAEVSRRFWGGAFLGQTQMWVAFRFTGTDDDIRLDGPHPEFSAHRWAEPAHVAAQAVSFKRRVYASVVEEFRRFWDRGPAG